MNNMEGATQGQSGLLNAANDSNKYSLPKLLSNASVQRMN